MPVVLRLIVQGSDKDSIFIPQACCTLQCISPCRTCDVVDVAGLCTNKVRPSRWYSSNLLDS